MLYIECYLPGFAKHSMVPASQKLTITPLEKFTNFGHGPNKSIQYQSTQRRNTMKMYVGNLSRDLLEDELRKEFTGFGAVDSVALIKDKFTGTLKGFGFVEMPVRLEAEAAVAGLNDKELKGRKMVVNEARPMTDRKSSNRGYGGYGGGNSSRY